MDLFEPTNKEIHDLLNKVNAYLDRRIEETEQRILQNFNQWTSASQASVDAAPKTNPSIKERLLEHIWKSSTLKDIFILAIVAYEAYRFGKTGSF